MLEGTFQKYRARELERKEDKRERGKEGRRPGRRGLFFPTHSLFPLKIRGAFSPMTSD